MSVMFFLKSRGGVLRIGDTTVFWNVFRIFLVFALLLVAPGAYAQNEISGPSCPGGKFGSDTILTGNVEMTKDDPVCIRLKDGANLDFRNHWIRCVSPEGCATAVHASKPNSTVFGGLIQSYTGNIAVAVHNAKRIHTMSINSPTTGVLGDPEPGDYTKKVDNNPFMSCGAFCVDVVMPDSTSFIRANEIASSIGGIKITGRDTNKSGRGPDVSSNTMSVVNTGLHQVGQDKKIRFFDNKITDLNYPHTIPCLVENTSLMFDPNQWGGNTCSDPVCCPAAPICPAPFSPGCTNNECVCQ